MNNKRNIRKLGTLTIMILLITLLILSIVSAECTDFVTYYGSCEGSGDIIVKDSQSNIIVEQFYSVNKGCYKNKYLVSVPGGSKDCPVEDGDLLSFSVSGLKYKDALWESNHKYVELNLERPTFKPIGNVVSPQSIYLLLSVLSIFVVVYLIFSFYRNRRNRTYRR